MCFHSLVWFLPICSSTFLYRSCIFLLFCFEVICVFVICVFVILLLCFCLSVRSSQCSSLNLPIHLGNPSVCPCLYLSMFLLPWFKLFHLSSSAKLFLFSCQIHWNSNACYSVCLRWCWCCCWCWCWCY